MRSTLNLEPGILNCLPPTRLAVFVQSAANRHPSQSATEPRGGSCNQCIDAQKPSFIPSAGKQFAIFLLSRPPSKSKTARQVVMLRSTASATTWQQQVSPGQA